MRGAAPCLHLDPLESLVPRSHLQIGRLGDHCSIGTPALDERLGTQAHVLFVDHRRDDETAAGQSSTFGQHTSRTQHRREPALHVLSATAVEKTASTDRLKRHRHPCNANGVRVATEHQRGPGCAALEHSNHVGPTRRDLRNLDGETGIGAFEGDSARDLLLALGPWRERRVHRVDRDEFLEQRDRPVGFHCAFSWRTSPGSARGVRSII